MSKLPGLLNRQDRNDGLPLVMGILNVTPDSFSDGGRFNHRETILKQVTSMLEAGVDIVDIGGESTRPGAAKVSLQEELDRVLPAIEWVQSCSAVAISIDTYKTAVMAESVKLGVDMINDVNALQAEGAVECVAESGLPVCLMHKQGSPETMQNNPSYGDVEREVSQFLQQRAQACLDAGISQEHIYIDPGFGFGKTLEHNVELFRNISGGFGLQYPVLVGVSRKTMIGALSDESQPEKRVIGSVAAAVVAMQKGARILRVHDVQETIQALKVAKALM